MFMLSVIINLHRTFSSLPEISYDVINDTGVSQMLPSMDQDGNASS